MRSRAVLQPHSYIRTTHWTHHCCVLCGGVVCMCDALYMPCHPCPPTAVEWWQYMASFAVIPVALLLVLVPVDKWGTAAALNMEACRPTAVFAALATLWRVRFQCFCIVPSGGGLMYWSIPSSSTWLRSQSACAKAVHCAHPSLQLPCTSRSTSWGLLPRFSISGNLTHVTESPPPSASMLGALPQYSWNVYYRSRIQHSV